MIMRKELAPAVYGPEQGFQPDTEVPRWVHNFVLNEEGMGGFCNYAGALLWLARNAPWIDGRVWVEPFMVPLLKDVFAEFPTWKVQPSPQFLQLVETNTATIGPGISVNGQQLPKQFFSCLGAHPMDVGTGLYYSTIFYRSECELPVLDYPEKRLPPPVRKLGARNYVVITCGGTTPIRTMTGEHINPLIDHVKSRGLTPVFLGKRDLLNTGKLTTSFADDTDFSKGLDLRDQTAVKDAACILQHAACTVGIDGGLLHLAAMMKDSRIVFGYNITSVEHRIPRRSHGRTINVTLTDEELPCIGCQSKWKSIPNHLYDECFYAKGRRGYREDRPERARACLRILFENNSERFKRAIDEAIG